MLLTGKTGGYHGYRQQTERTACFKRTDAGGTGGPFRAFQGIYFPAGTGSHLPVHCDIDGHFAVPGLQPSQNFFQEEPEDQIVFRNEDYFEKIDSELGSKTEWIIPNAQKNMMEPIRLTLKPGGLTYRDLPHEGEEFGYVLKGSIKIHIGHKSYTAKKGESFYFTPHSEHYIEAFGTSGAVILWVSTPPNF